MDDFSETQLRLVKGGSPEDSTWRELASLAAQSNSDPEKMQMTWTIHPCGDTRINEGPVPTPVPLFQSAKAQIHDDWRSLAG